MKNPLSRSGPEDLSALDNGPKGRSVPPAKGKGAKGSMIDGPFGGKKPA